MEKSNTLKESLGNFLRNAFDLMVINWMFILCCIPVITIGPALCAMMYVMLKLSRGEPVSAARDFLRSFRENFKSGLILGLLAMALLVIACGDCYFALQQADSGRSLFLVVGILMGALFLLVLSYGFALQAMFENPVKIQLLNTVKLAFVAPGKTVMLWLIWLAPVLLALALPFEAVAHLGFLYVLMGFSLPAFGAGRILRDVFDKVNGSPVIPE